MHGSDILECDDSSNETINIEDEELAVERGVLNTKKAKIWCFTTNNVENTELVMQDEGLICWIGPFENDSGRMQAHGVIGWGDHAKSKYSLTKSKIVKTLKKYGIQIANDYVSALRTTRQKWINYIFKSFFKRYGREEALKRIPKSALAWAKANGVKLMSTDERLYRLQKQFPFKPTEAAWEKACIKEFGITGIQEQTIRRGLKVLWQPTVSSKLRGWTKA